MNYSCDKLRVKAGKDKHLFHRIMDAKKEQKAPEGKKIECKTYGCKYFSGEPIEGLPLPGIPPQDILCVGQKFYLCPTHEPFQSAKSNFDKLFGGQLKEIYKNLSEGETREIMNYNNQ